VITVEVAFWYSRIMFRKLTEEIRELLGEGRKSALKKIKRAFDDPNVMDMHHGLKDRGDVIPRIPQGSKHTVVKVPHHALTATQSDVGAGGVETHVKDPQLSMRNPERFRSDVTDTSRPVVAKKGGRLFVVDGHHRLAARKLQGKKHTKVKLFDLDRK